MTTVEGLFDPQENGGWVVTFPSLGSHRIRGRNLSEARRKAELYLAAVDGQAVLSESVRLPLQTQDIIAEARRARARADEARRRANECVREAIRQLTKSISLSQRDVASLLDLSHQRIHQLSREPAVDKPATG